MDEHAHSEIMIRLADDVAREVVSKTSPESLWDALESLYIIESLFRKISLLCKLFTFKMDVNLSMNDNLDKFLRLIQELARCDDNVKDSHHTVLLLNSCSLGAG